jgi:hypothetical protein
MTDRNTGLYRTRDCHTGSVSTLSPFIDLGCSRRMFTQFYTSDVSCHTSPYATRACVETEQADSRMSATNRRNSITVVVSKGPHWVHLSNPSSQPCNSLRLSNAKTGPVKHPVINAHSEEVQFHVLTVIRSSGQLHAPSTQTTWRNGWVGPAVGLDNLKQNILMYRKVSVKHIQLQVRFVRRQGSNGICQKDGLQ